MPGGVHDLADGGLDALVAVRDHQLHAAKATTGEAAQKVRPEGLRLRWADFHAQDLTSAVGVRADGYDDRHRDDATVLAHLDVGRVDPEVRPVAFDRPVEEGLHPHIDVLAQPRDLALGDAAHSHRLDQIIHRARGDSLDVSLLDHRRQRLLRQPPRLQEEREVAPLAQLGDTQLHGAGPGLPVAIPVAVALGQPLGALLAVGRARALADLQLHQPLGAITNRLTQQIGVGALLHQRLQVHHVVGHLRSSSRVASANPSLPKIVDDRRYAARSLRRHVEGARRERLRYHPSYTTTRDTTPLETQTLLRFNVRVPKHQPVQSIILVREVQKCAAFRLAAAGI